MSVMLLAPSILTTPRARTHRSSLSTGASGAAGAVVHAIARRPASSRGSARRQVARGNARAVRGKSNAETGNRDRSRLGRGCPAVARHPRGSIRPADGVSLAEADGVSLGNELLEGLHDDAAGS